MKSKDEPDKGRSKKIKSAAYQPGFDTLKIDESQLQNLLTQLGLDDDRPESNQPESNQFDSNRFDSNRFDSNQSDGPERSLPPGTLTVESVAFYIKSSLEDDPNLQRIWVLGEISSVNRSGKGTYFTLQDPESNQSIACVVWNSSLDRLQTKPQQGEQVIVLANIKTYSPQSRYQLQIIQIRSAGEGLQALRYQQLRDRLTAEGLFDPHNKQPLPSHPQTIAVVTSPNAAAWGDIQTTLLQRYPGLKVLLSPATVQGETAPASIAKAIARVISHGRAEVLILARGGGAVEDLACFNDERVVRAIATCGIPVISGIGHDRDESLADLAADYAAHTPTAAAETAVPDLTDLAMQHLQRAILAQDIMSEVLSRHQTRLETLQRRLQLIRPDRQLTQAQEKLHWLKQQMIQSMRSQLLQSQATHDRLQTKLTALDPHAVLERGYAVVRSSRAQQSGIEPRIEPVIKSAEELAMGQTIEIQLGEGRVVATIVSIH